MADEGIDECELPQEMAMRCLLSFMRQTQTECTDTGCLDMISRNPQVDDDGGNFFTMTMFVILIAIMFLMGGRLPTISASIKITRTTTPEPPGDRQDPPALT